MPCFGGKEGRQTEKRENWWRGRFFFPALLVRGFRFGAVFALSEKEVQDSWKAALQTAKRHLFQKFEEILHHQPEAEIGRELGVEM